MLEVQSAVKLIGFVVATMVTRTFFFCIFFYVLQVCRQSACKLETVSSLDEISLEAFFGRVWKYQHFFLLKNEYEVQKAGINCEVTPNRQLRFLR